MRTALLLLLLVVWAGAASAQSISLVNSIQPTAAPVAPSTANHPVLRFGLYRATGNPPCNLTQVAITMAGTAVATSDWTFVDLYADTDHSGTVTGADTLLASTSTTVAGKAIINGLTRAIPEGFANADDLLVVVDVAAAATAGRTFQMSLAPADVVVSAGTVSNLTSNPNSATHTVTLNNGCEIDVRYNAVSQPSSSTELVYLGQVVTTGTRNFAVHNTGTGQLDLTGSPRVLVVFTNNCAVTLTSPPAATVAVGANTPFTLQIDPTLAQPFSFRITIASNDFDENPYTLVCSGTGGTDPYMALTQGATPVADGSSFAVGSQTAGVNVNLNFTIRNDGFGNLNLTGTPNAVQISSTQNVSVTITSAPTTPVAQGGGTSGFVLQYRPLGGGNFGFSVQILNNDTFHNPYNFSVSGTAPAVAGTQLTVTRDPVAPNAGSSFATQPIVAVTNSVGAVDTGNNTAQVTATITSGTGAAGAVLTGTVTRTAVGGYVNFNDLKINLQGTGYTLTFTNGTFGTAACAAFDVGPALPGGGGGGGGGGSKSDSGGCSTDSKPFGWLMLAGLGALLCFARRQRRA